LTVTDAGSRAAGATQSVTVTGLPIDTTAPLISNLRARPARVRRGRPMNFRFRLSEEATVRFKIQRLLPGRRQGGRCRKPTARNRSAPRCTRVRRVTSFTRKAKLGPNKVRFSGKVRRRALARGRYRAVLTATDAAGNRSAARRVAFVVI
jgi:hypothetical protein